MFRRALLYLFVFAMIAAAAALADSLYRPPTGPPPCPPGQHFTQAPGHEPGVQTCAVNR